MYHHTSCELSRHVISRMHIYLDEDRIANAKFYPLV
jgi:hypothetical protein